MYSICRQSFLKALLILLNEWLIIMGRPIIISHSFNKINNAVLFIVQYINNKMECFSFKSVRVIKVAKHLKQNGLAVIISTLHSC